MTTKEELIEKALLLFSEEGYESIGVQTIVDGLGLSKPTLYHHFGNKAGLLRSILDQYTGPFIEGLKLQILYNQDIILSTETLVLFYLSYVQKYPVFYRLKKNLYYSPLKSESHTIMANYHDKEIALVQSLFEAIGQHHTGLKGKSEILAYTFLGHLDAYITFHVNGNLMERMTQEEGRKLAKQFLYGVFA